MIDIVNSYEQRAKELYENCDIYYNKNIWRDRDGAFFNLIKTN